MLLKMNRLKVEISKLKITLLFSITIFLTILITLFFSILIIFLLVKLKIMKNYNFHKIPILVFALISLLCGAIISSFTSKKAFHPFTKIMFAIDQISKGNYNVKIDLKGPNEIMELGEKFNNMTNELNSVEMLRSDFINTFSHEFKTPIVSIRGFAKLLKRDDLTEEEKERYLDIIIDESERLTELSTNVLSLSKIEQQTILTNKSKFNVSEEIRLVIVLLFSKWNRKNIDIAFDAEEFYILGNQELLKQVWINLLDNAIKFTPEFKAINIKIKKSKESLIFNFINEGEEISEEVKKHIFDKFYQGDKSRNIRGNGLGLSIAKKIVDLHNGSLILETSNYKETVFTVTLPI